MSNRKYAVMLFDTEINLGISSHPNKWVNYDTLYFDKGLEALFKYSDIPCPASQLISAEDDYELQCKMGQMLVNYSDNKWLEENLYPYL